MKNILVTGANGLLGMNTIIELLAKEYCVRGFLRDSRKFPFAIRKNLELIEGDILVEQKLDSALVDCDCVIHTAAITDQGLLSYDSYYKVNVQGVINVTKSAIKNKVRRIIYVGTANEFGYGDLYDLGNETNKMKYPYNKLFYARSKKAAHDFLLSKKNEIEVVVVNPTFMIGPFDSKPSSGKIVLMGLKNRFIFCPPGGKNFVCAKDVARGIVNAIQYGKNGESYLMASENLTFNQFFERLKDHVDNDFFIINLSSRVVLLVGLFGSALRLIKVRTQFSYENMKSLCINNFYSNSKARLKLGVVFNPIDEGIRESVSWFRKKQMS